MIDYDFGSCEQRFWRAGCPYSDVALIVVRLIEHPVVGTRQDTRLDKGTQVGHLASFGSRSTAPAPVGSRSGVFFDHSDSCSIRRFAY